MKDLISEYLDMYLDANNVTLTDEQRRQVSSNVEHWLCTNLPDAVGDSITNVQD